MNISEVLTAVGEWLNRVSDRTAFLLRTYRVTAIFLVLLLGGALLIWIQAGLTFEIGRFFAATPTPTPTPHAPWSYCDAATKSCKQAPPLPHNLVSQDYDAPQCGSGACVPGQCRKWEGTDKDNWKPGSSPSGVPACEPLTEWSEETFPGFGTPYFLEGKALPPGVTTPGWYTPTPRKPPPMNFPDCLHIEQYSSFPEGPVAGPGKAQFKAFVVNNCPWEVHFVQLVATSNAASGNPALSQSACSLDQATWETFATEDTTPGRDIPSCWNSGRTGRPPECGKFLTIDYDLNAFTCGSVGFHTDWWHRVGPDSNLSDSYCDKEGRCPGLKTSRGTGAIWSINWSRDCTGAISERSPAKGCGNPAASPSGQPGTLPSPAQLSVVCGATQNTLTWVTPLPAGSDASAINKTSTPPGGTPTSQQIGIDLSRNPSSYIDTDVRAGYTYSYVFKNHVAVRSNEVVCRPANASPIVTATATATTIATATLRPTVVVSPTARGCPGDADCDGIPDDVECPGGAPTFLNCPDTDGDGIPDYLDTDSDNDGIPDSSDPNRLVKNTQTGPASAVPTGPGETTLLALLMGALVALLYAGYTHSDIFRRKEASELSRDQGPLDFKG